MGVLGMKPNCPNCGSKKAKPHCVRVSDREKLITIPNPRCPWFRCLNAECGHTYDRKGNHYDPKEVRE